MDGCGAEGRRVVARWREAREWWGLEPYVEVTASIEESGTRRVDERTAPSMGLLNAASSKAVVQPPEPKQEWAASKATGESREDAKGVPEAYLARLAEERRAAGPLARERYAPTRPDSRPQPILQGTSWSADVRQRAERELSSDAKEGRAPDFVLASPSALYAPLHMLSGYAFGRSTMLAEELASYAAQSGCPAAAIADPFSLTGAMEFSKASRRNGVKPLIGATIELPEGGEIVLIARSKRGYVSLSRLVTACHLGEPRGFPLATWRRLEEHAEGLLCLTGGDVGPLDRLLVRRDLDGARSLVERLASVYGRSGVFLEVERSFMPWGMAVERRLMELAEATGTTAVAGGVVTHARRSHYPAQDALLCAESLCLLDDVIGRKARRHPTQPQAPRYPERSLNAERFLRTSAEMGAHYADRPELLHATLGVADLCEDDVLPGRARLPSLFPCDDHALKEIVESEMHAAYGRGLSDAHRERLRHEVDRIQRMGFSSHFLLAWDFVRWSREQGIGSSGRGSVVDSAVAFVLGFSEIDAIEHRLHFDRFLPEDASKRPDIDIDFEAGRRDDVRGYVVRRHGLHRVAGLAAIGTYRARGIVRDVGKAFGLPEETISFLAKKMHGGVTADGMERALERRPELRNSGVPKERFRWVFALAERLMDVPTGVGLHSAGVIVSDSPLMDVAPVVWSASPPSKESGSEEPHFRMLQWDKRSAKHCFDKFDVLCLRGQDVIGGTEARVRASSPDFSSKRVDAVGDKEVYRAMRSGELTGIPQSASPAMRQAHQRLQTDDLHDASMVQAGIRPGVGGAVKLNELIARRRGKAYSFEHPLMEGILGHTYGIIVFQEQADQLLQAFCGLTGGEAEEVRDSMWKRRKEGYAEGTRDALIERSVAQGFARAIAERAVDLCCQFKGYAFAQGHALAFAEVSLRSVSLMQNHPAEYFAALLSNQPAGYYGPVTICNEARARGVRVLPLDVNRSRGEFWVEDAYDPSSGMSVPQGAIRVGLTQISGLSARTRDAILEHQEAALGSEDQRPRQAMSSPTDAGGGTAVTTAGLGDPERERLWRSAGLRAFGSMFDFVAKVRPSRDELEALILCGALDSLHPNRRAMLWAIKAAMDFGKAMRPSGPNPMLPLDLEEPPLDLSMADFSEQERAVHERRLLGMDVERHLVAFERERALAKGCVTTSQARRLKRGTKAIVVGNPIRLRFPPTSSGKRVVFWDLEDETGLLNCTCFDDVYQRDGRAIVCEKYITAVGVIQDRDEHHKAFLIRRVYPYSPCILEGKASLPIATADFLVG